MANVTTNSSVGVVYTSVFSPVSTTSISPTPSVLSMSTSIASTVMVPTRNITIMPTTTSPSSGLNLKQRLLFVLLGSLLSVILLVVIIFALMYKYGKKVTRTPVTPISTDTSDEQHERSAPPRPVWSEKAQRENKK